MDLLNICDMLPIKATIKNSVMVDVWLPPWPDRNYTLLRRNDKMGRVRGIITGGVIYVADSNPHKGRM